MSLTIRNLSIKFITAALTVSLLAGCAAGPAASSVGSATGLAPHRSADTGEAASASMPGSLAVGEAAEEAAKAGGVTELGEWGRPATSSIESDRAASLSGIPVPVSPV